MEEETTTKQEDPPDLERGRDLSRILAFTDGVFAIAITLLVLQIEVPTGLDSDRAVLEGVADQASDLLAYAISFAVIGFFWIDDHRFMRMVGEFDTGLMWRQLFYLGVLVLIPFTSQTLGEYGDFHIAAVLYVANMTLLAAAGAAVCVHVVKQGLAKPELRAEAELTKKSALFTTGFFLLTLPLAFLLGPWTPLVWILLWFDPFQRQRERLQESRQEQRAEQTSDGEPDDDSA